MKNKNAEPKTFSFHSVSAPCDFAAIIKEEAINSNLKIELNDTDFILQLDSNHGGRIVYKATVTADESGGSYISGEIVTIPWNEAKNRTKTQRTLQVIGYIRAGIALLPGIILVSLFMVFYELFLLIKNKGKRELPREEKKLLDFMLNKLCCKRK